MRRNHTAHLGRVPPQGSGTLGENCEVYSLDRITKRKKRKGSTYSTMPMFAGRNGMLEMAVEQIEQLRNVSGE